MKADVCHWCGAPKNNRSRNKYCSRKCYWESKIGIEGYWSGKKRPDIAGENSYMWRGGQRHCECGQPIASRSSKVKMCGACRNRRLSEKRGDKHHNWTGGKPSCVDCGKKLGSYRSVRCKPCMGDNNRGENNPFIRWGQIKYGKDSPAWRGGLTPENKKQRIKFRKTVQKQVLERDNYTCQLCGNRGGHLQVDHIQPWAEFVELRFDINNCRTLCMACHYKITFGRELPEGVSTWGHNFSQRGGLDYSQS